MNREQEAASAEAIEREREIRALKFPKGQQLHGSNVAGVLLYGLSQGPEPEEEQMAAGMLRSLRSDLAGFARLAICAGDSLAGEVIVMSEHIGEPLLNCVRRLDVAIEILERQEYGRRARRERRKAKRGGAAP
jgi:hypothetical protein